MPECKQCELLTSELQTTNEEMIGLLRENSQLREQVKQHILPNEAEIMITILCVNDHIRILTSNGTNEAFIKILEASIETIKKG